MGARVWAVVLITIVANGCVRSVTSNPYNPRSTNDGVVYSLPKTRLKLTITYTIEKETTLKNGIPVSKEETVKISKPIVVEPILAPDWSNTFVLSGEGLAKDSRLALSFKFAVGENQLLTSVTTDVTDKTPEAIGSLVGAGISIAKMAAVAGEEKVPPPLQKVQARLRAIDDEFATLASQSDPKKLEKLDALVKEQQALVAFAAKYQELNTPKTEQREVTYSRVLDFADLSWDSPGSLWTTAVQAPGKMLGPNINDYDVPRATIEVFATSDQHTNATTPFAVPDKGADGILYRAPVPLHTKITIAPNSVVVFDDLIAFAQAGAVDKVQARYKVFSNRKTSVTFSTATGSLKEYGVDTTSSAEAAAKALDTSLTKVQTAVTDIQKAQKDAKLAELETQKKLVDAQAALLKAQQDAAKAQTPEQEKLADLDTKKKVADAEAALIKAQQELDKLKSGSGPN